MANPFRRGSTAQPARAWRRGCALATVAWLALTAATAAARREHHVSNAAQARADRLTQEGIAALAADKPADALRAFASAYRLSPAPELLFRLGSVAVAEKRILDAQDLMGRFLLDPSLDVSPEAPEHKEAERVLQLPTPPSGKLNILGDRGTLVVVDDRLVAELPLTRPLLVSPAEHKVTLEAGSRRQEDTVQVPAGRTAELRFDRTSNALLSTLLPGVLFQDQYQGVPLDEQKRLLQALEEAVLTEHASPVPLAFALQQAGDREVAACLSTPGCQARLARKVEAEYVLTAKVTRDQKRWQFQIDFVDAEVGDISARTSKTCSPCTVEQAAAALAATVAPLYGETQRRPRGTLEVSSQPAGATLTLDGVLLGATPQKKVVWSGRHSLLLQLGKYQDHREEVEVAANQTATVAAELAQTLALPPRVVTEWRRHPRPLWRLAVGGSLVAGGLITAIGVLGRLGCLQSGSCAIPDDKGELQGLSPGGGTLVGLGFTFAVGGVVLMALPGSRYQTQVTVPQKAD